MGDEGFGIMDLLQKLFKERQQNTTGGVEVGKGAVSDTEYKTLMQGGSEIPDSLKGLNKTANSNFLSASGMSDKEFEMLSNPYGGAMNRTNQLNAITGGATHTMPDGTVMQGATHGDYGQSYNTGGALGAISDQEFQMLREKSLATGRPEGKPSDYMNRNLGAVSDREAEVLNRSQLATMGVAPVSDVDTMFAQALQGMSPDQANEVIMTIQNYTPDQQQTFKAQFLQGNVPQYELEAQSNLGF